jgi:hypothetical protein
LITGTVPYWFDDCPDNIALGYGIVTEGLNKDDPGTDVCIAGRVKRERLHVKAVELAIAQTLHEWCRLVNLVERFQGEEGKQKLFDQWVANRAKAEKNARVYKAHVYVLISNWTT